MAEDTVNGSLSEALKSAFVRASGTWINGLSLVAAYYSSDYDLSMRAYHVLRGLGDNINHAFRKDVEYGCLEDYSVCLGHSSAPFGPSNCCVPLLLKALSVGSVDDALRWLDSVVVKRKAYGKMYCVVFGAEVDRVIRLFDGISLIPLSSLIDAPSAVHVPNRRLAMHSIQNSFGVIYGKKLSVLVEDVVVEPFLISRSNFRFPHFLAKLKSNDICLALSATGPRSMLEVMSWLEYDDPDVHIACPYQATSKGYPEVLPDLRKNYLAIDPNEARSIVSAYFCLNDAVKSRVVYSLHRLRLAMLRHNEGDCAVELAIALESLLTHENENSAISHKISVRAAKILENDVERRLEICGLVKKMYNVRSRVAHGGDWRTIKNASSIVSEASLLCAKVVRHVIMAGRIPNFAELDVG